MTAGQSFVICEERGDEWIHGGLRERACGESHWVDRRLQEPQPRSRSAPELLLKDRLSDLTLNEVDRIVYGQIALDTHQIAILHPIVGTA